MIHAFNRAPTYAVEGIRLHCRGLRNAHPRVSAVCLRWQIVAFVILSALVLKLGPGAVDLVAHHAMPLVGGAMLLAIVGFNTGEIRCGAGTNAGIDQD